MVLLLLVRSSNPVAELAATAASLSGAVADRKNEYRSESPGPLRSPSQAEPARYESWFSAIPVASSLGCETGRRTVVWIRIAGAAAQPIAACAARYRDGVDRNIAVSSFGHVDRIIIHLKLESLHPSKQLVSLPSVDYRFIAVAAKFSADPLDPCFLLFVGVR
jgi:hypothetical protein